MKKIKLISVLLLMMLLTSCIMKDHYEKKEDNKLNLVDTSKRYAEIINSGEYKKDNFYDNFSEEYKSKNSKNKLYKKIEHFNSITGPIKSFERTQLSESSVILEIDNKLRKSTEIYTYNVNGQLNNISLFPGSIKAYRNSFYETVPVTLQRDNLNIPAALTLPADTDNPKIAILVPGLGPRDMDDTIGLSGNKPMEDLAEGLARNGIATLRYDKSLIHGADRNTIEDEYFLDFNAAYSYIMSLDNVDKTNIYIIGHDTGASLAPVLAEGKDIKGIVIMAGSLKNLSDIILEQNMTIINQSNGLSPAEKKDQITQIKNKVDETKNIDKNSKKVLFGLSASYWDSLNNLNLKDALMKYKGRILVLQGSNDFEIIPENNYYEYYNLLSGNSKADFELFNGLNHIFSPSGSKKYNMSIYDAKLKVSTQVIDRISNWINSENAQK